MAILLLGKTSCKICGNIITDKTKFVSLPAFVFNDCDALIYFNDSAFHETCFLNHNLSKKVIKRVEKLMQEILPKKRICSICQKQITNPDDYLFLGYITDNINDKLSEFNYIKLHLSCLPNWLYVNNFKELLERDMSNQKVKGSYYENILKQLNLNNTVNFVNEN